MGIAIDLKKGYLEKEKTFKFKPVLGQNTRLNKVIYPAESPIVDSPNGYFSPWSPTVDRMKISSPESFGVPQHLTPIRNCEFLEQQQNEVEEVRRKINIDKINFNKNIRRM